MPTGATNSVKGYHWTDAIMQRHLAVWTILCRLLVVAKQAAQASMEEDDYDADEDAQAHTQPSAPAVQPLPIIPALIAKAPAAHQSGATQV